mmetsp:Transcript_6232/g.9566  ORF Transcript_6232/g.9566 Transcript_6232/m.9566 type:complete len:137 (+) Transcript_6232:143-553(+)|eukprot:CAMPEP_0198695872 /NCGR_PEP_ID=MMETSP1468-20131203/296045_1 /TAXON_ID=1461545 /ORGANISM="Mantoniella sp, Strain CCMP1436" /LENGTH=136 /DNA_ID=CAMNT_0044451819 /DNA_START=142 /DNA_END=552 /DNA_ORIENTATION=+
MAPTNASATLQCAPGVFECAYASQFERGPLAADTLVPFTCALSDGRYPPPEDLGWLVGAAFLVSAVMAVGIGANDASNSWGTTVGSGALSLRRAVILGGACEWLGAVTLGAGVAKTIKGTSSIQDPQCWAGNAVQS